MERADSSMVWTFQTFLDIVELSWDVYNCCSTLPPQSALPKTVLSIVASKRGEPKTSNVGIQKQPKNTQIGGSMAWDRVSLLDQN